MIYKRTKSWNHQLVIKWPIGDFDLGIGVLGLGIGDFPKSWKHQFKIQLVILAPIGDFNF